MDKKPNRTDLLTAGRKKLQQYRQKKDNKGKDGKGKDGKTSNRSTSKADKPEENDAGANLVSSANTMKAESSQVPAVEIESSENSLDFSVDTHKPLDNSEGVSADSQNNGDPTGLDSVSAEKALNHELDCTTPNEEREVEIKAREVEGSETSGSTEFNTVHVDVLAPSPESAPDAESIAEMVAADSVEVKSLLEGDQVSVDADSFDPTHSDRSVELELGRDEMPPVSNANSEKLIALHPEVEFGVSAAAISGFVGDHETVEVSIPAETIPAVPKTASLTELNRQGEDVTNRSFDENSFYLQSVTESRYFEREGNHAHFNQIAVEGYDETNLLEGSGVVDVKSHKDVESNLGDSMENRSMGSGVQSNPLYLVQLAEVLKRLPEGDFRYLIKSREITDQGNFSVPRNGMVALSETIQEQLYLANISKDFFYLQLLEQNDSKTDYNLDEVPALTALLTNVQECNKNLSVELAQCRSELEVAISEKLNFQNMYHYAKEESAESSAKVDELEIKLDDSVTHISSLSADLANSKVLLEASQSEHEKLLKSLESVSEQRKKFEEAMQHYSHENQKLSVDMADSSAQLDTLKQEITNLKVILASVTDERKKFEEEKVLLSHEKEMLLGDLADCRRVILTLQQENSGLNTSLAVLIEESKELKDHEEFLVQEFGRISTELVYYQDKMSMQYQEHVQLEAELREAMSRLEQISEENIVLRSSLEIHKARIAEIDSSQIQLSSVGTGSRTDIQIADTGDSVENFATEDTEAGLPSVSPAAGNGSDATSLSELQSGFSEGTLTLKRYLEEAEKLMQKLEKEVDGMHSHSVSLSRLSGKNTAPGVSKLIQAFETKANSDDHEPEERLSTESVGLLDPYFAAKEQISCLGDVFQALAQNVENVDALIMDESSRCKAAIVACGELEVEVESLKGISCNLEARNIELEVICGVMNQHAHDTEAKKTQLEDLCEVLNRQYADSQLQNIELHRKLTDTQSRITGLQDQLKELRKSSVEVASMILNEFEALQREMREHIYSVEREWNSSFAELVPMVQKLDTVVKSVATYPFPSEVSHDMNIFGRFSVSVTAACEVIQDWKSRLEAHDELSSSYTEVEEKLCVVNEERSFAIGLLQKISADMVNLLNVTVEHFKDSTTCFEENNQQNPLDGSYYEALIAKLCSLLGNILQLKESNNKLSSDLLKKAHDIEELNKRCLDTDTLLKLILDVKEILKVHDTEVNLDEAPVLNLQSLVLLLVQKFKELEEHASSSVNEVNSRVMELDELRGNVELLNSLKIQLENENLVLRASLIQAKDGFDVMQAELLHKVKELEQSEQRVSSVREKLSIAVAKGKGLVVQRDSLKQSLAEMSSELDKCSQELQLKDSRLLEVEEKLKDYSEAGERMEALESELTYIRNSATALRESFFLKDSSLQRIEEILEDLELPDHFHSKDILEKVDWLAKTVAGNSLPPDWDQRSSVGGGSFSDAGFVVTDGGKDDVQPASNLDDDPRRKYEELQTKFYELAEQNDMLEQSLMERNILVQRWEEILDRINTPTQIRSMEPEERIHWLGTAVSEADHHMRSLQQKIENLEDYSESLSNDLEKSQRKIYEVEAVLHEKESALSEADVHTNSLQQKIDNFESYCGSLSTDLKESRRRISELESSLHTVIQDKETLSSSLVTLTSDRDIALHTVEQYELELDSLRKEVVVLQGNLAKNLRNEDQLNQIESDLKRLQSLILDVLQDFETEDESSGVSNIQVLEKMIIKLVNRDREVDAEGQDLKAGVQERTLEHAAKSLMVTDMENEDLYGNDVMDKDDLKSRSGVHEGKNVADLSRELSEALDEIVMLREERDLYLQKNQSTVTELEQLDRRQKELQELLNQEEQKSASLREKLNLAVRKGKSLVQQRDGLKQNIEEMSTEINRLKSMMNGHESSLVESGQKIRDLCLQIEAYKAFEAENLSLKNRLIEVEQQLQQNSHTLSILLSRLGEINTGEGTNAHDPLQKLEGIVNMLSDLQHSAASFELEAKKSKKSAELLLAELNEVQERNDGLQEELEIAQNEISKLSKEKDLVNSAKIEALSHVSKLSGERENQLAELERLKSSVHEVKKVFFDISTVSEDMFAKDLELLHDVKAHMESRLEIGSDPVSAKDHGGLGSVNSRFKDFWSRTSWGNKIPDPIDESADVEVCKVIEQHLQQLKETITDFKERIHSHSMSLRTEAEWLSTAVGTMRNEVASQRSSLESIKDDNIHLESVGKEKDIEGVVLRRSISLLYETCISSILEIENKKAQLVGKNICVEDLRINLPALPTADGMNFSGVVLSSSEESVKSLADKLLVAVRDFVDIGIKGVEGQSKEMKTTISDLQQELQEKDIQRERICRELVSQIKEAESTAANCSRDLQSMTNYTHDLENKLKALGRDRTLLEQRVAELQEECLNSAELGEKVKSLSAVVDAKEQEIEALMQALEEEENQMESVRSEIEELEKTVRQKNIDLENVEASRAKALKKLSVTVSKFDELHHMSEGLLSEIENLQTQLQDRDAEISFLRQEVTRCTNDVLEATKMEKERFSGELNDFLTWLDTNFSCVLKRDAHAVDGNVSHHPEYKEQVQRDITSIISELEDLRLAAQSKDTLLQAERNKMEELLHRKEAIEASLHEKELYINSLQGVGVSGLGTSEIVEVEPVLNKWTPPVPSSQVRSLRKVNNDQVSIAIDTDAGSSGRIEDEEDDKVHGFKSLTTSRFVPRFTRPVSDMIDGLWVSCDRALMRQPAFRLGIMIYWAVLHAFLASFIV
ncbi:trans-Golgi network-localized SYP41-interacting protein 1 isoform X2 [Spinacia oleracea]|uniref:Trans-Golgi network-localized SYP41-interacting protein 1 isoform X2 n=1 Tax=Spinacia oleracea TaxID=3562 RepID=A0ABM3R7Y7_SPIOL|nr:trans-Golgi network-localized SYP41-interacting protein 1 isoform X2 [Spinacia oleracea]